LPRNLKKKKGEGEMAHKKKMTHKKKKLYQSTSGHYYRMKTKK